MAEPRIILDGDPVVSVIVRRSSRARRLSLRVSRLDGRVTLTVPRGVPEHIAQDFVAERADWLRKQLMGLVQTVLVQQGVLMPIEGQIMRISGGSGRSVTRTQDAVCVPGSEERIPARLRAYLKGLAQDRLLAASDHYARRVGRSYGRMTLRDTRSRWGSCTSDGNLMYSWRLIMAPPAVLDYVAAHEVAHLVEMNHSAAYWDVVAGICPDYRQHRDWLRLHGTELHRYRFET